MNTKYKYLYSCLFLFTILFACDEDIADYEKLSNNVDDSFVYIAKSVKGIQSLTIFPYQDERKATLGVNYGGLGLPANNITVKLAVNHEALDSLNVIRQNEGLDPYLLFPNESYSLDKYEYTIPKGEQYSDLGYLTYYPETFDSQKDYVLPLSISEISNNYRANPRAKTVFFTANKLELSPANTSNWIATASSSQDNGWENTGLASAVLDGDLGTIWHSEYSPNRPGYPHTLEFDMINSIYVEKVALAPRQNNTSGPTKFYLEGSVDGSSWIKLNENDFDFNPSNKNYQEYQLANPQTFKKMRLVLTEGRQDVSFLAEFVVYTYQK